METRVIIKFSLIHVVLVIRVQKDTWSKTLYHLFAYFKQKRQCI